MLDENATPTPDRVAPTDEPIPTILLTVSGLRASALGAYGATAHETPTFNRLATEAFLYDQALVTEPTEDELLRHLATQLPASQTGLLVTDNRSLAESEVADRFNRSVHLPLPALEDAAGEDQGSTPPAESMGETSLATLFEQFAEELVTHRSDEEHSGKGAWLHVGLLQSVWDAPHGLVESLLDEEDPEIAPSTEPAKLLAEKDRETLAELSFAELCRYTAQILLLDACLDQLLDLLAAIYPNSHYRLVVAGASGYGLGEHQRWGRPDGAPQLGLHSEERHVPLIVYDSQGENAFARDGHPRSVSITVASHLAQTASSPDLPLVLRSEAPGHGVRSLDWYACQHQLDQPAELYVKPDDRWEQNDVATLREEVVAELLAVEST